MKLHMGKSALLATLLAVCAVGAHAGPITDAANDLLPTYVGAHNGDVDVLSAFVGYNPTTDRFSFSGTFGAAVGTTTGAFYVWGLDRGQGTERFNTGLLPVGQGVKFDSVVILRQNGSASLTLFNPAGNIVTNLGLGVATILDNTISATIDGALLGSNGFEKLDYTWNLWPRIGAGNANISDFAPDASNVAVTAVPEPATYALMGLGLALVGITRRRQKTN